MHVPESIWCLDCIMEMLASDTPQALDLLSAELPLSAQIYAAGHCGVYAQMAIARSPSTHPAVLSYLVLASDSPAVRSLAIKKAATSVVTFTLAAEKQPGIIEAAIAVMRQRGNAQAAEIGEKRLKKIAAESS